MSLDWCLALRLSGLSNKFVSDSVVDAKVHTADTPSLKDVDMEDMERHQI